MEWVKLIATPAYFHDGALLRAGEAAEVLFCRALAHSGFTESKGRIDKTVLPLLVPSRAQARAEALVREGLWLDEGTHYLIRSWDKWQDEHDAAAVRKAQDRERKRRKRAEDRGRASGDMSAGQSADVPPDTSEPRPESPPLDREGEGETERTSGQPAAPPRLDVEQVCSAVVSAEAAKGSKKPLVTEAWRTQARLMLDADKRELAEVLNVIEWTRDHQFWRANVRSVPKLREQFDTLRLQRLSEIEKRRLVSGEYREVAVRTDW
jgi:hypothetical protein